MGIFGNNKKVDDSKKGSAGDLPPDPKAGEGDTKDKFATKEEFDSLKSTMEQINLKLEVFGQPAAAPATPTAPPVDTGAKLSTDIAKIEEDLAAIDSKIDEAVYAGKGVGDLIKKRDRLNEKKLELKFDHKFETFRSDGVQVLDQISDQVTQGQMPHLTIPEVKKNFEESLNAMAPEVRMNPEVRLAAYNLAVGQNVDKIADLKVQESLRKEDPPDLTTDPSARTKRNSPDEKGKIPSPEDILSKDNLDAIKAAGHSSIDSYYKKLGYDGWVDHYEQNKDFYEEGGE